MENKTTAAEQIQAAKTAAADKLDSFKTEAGAHLTVPPANSMN